MRRKAALLLAASLAACGSGSEEGGPKRVPQTEAPPAVHFPRYRPSDRGGPTAFMEAGMGGVLVLSGPCLGFASGGPGRLSTIIWPASARLGSDATGPFVEIGQERFRPGDDLKGGGGTMPTDFSDRLLIRPFPAECDRSNAVEFHSIEPAGRNPWPVPTVPPAPPPPASEKRR